MHMLAGKGNFRAIYCAADADVRCIKRKKMTENSPKTIQIYLPQGTSQGQRIAEITSRTVQAIQVPRAGLAFAGTRTETKSVGVYLLLSQDDVDESRVYVGEAEDCYKRLIQHSTSKEFWNTAIVFVSQKQQFTKSHVKYLEWFCIKSIENAGRMKLINSVMPSEPYVQEPVVADLHDCFETIRILTSILGYPVFEYLRKNRSVADGNRVFINAKNAKAEGEYTTEGFVLFKGALCNPTVSKAITSSSLKRRNSLKENGVLEVQDGDLILVKDHLFSSPSAAGALVLGRETNGWTTWKFSTGKTLDEVIRQGDAQTGK
jgi:hypothetical protein